MAEQNAAARKIAVLMEGDYYEPEIWYYRLRFAEEGFDVRFLTRLWGQPPEAMARGFLGHEYRVPFDGRLESFEEMDDATLRGFSAVIVPAGMVADRLRYTEDVNKVPPATQFLARAFAEKTVLKGIICHGLWLVAPLPHLVKGRPLVCHNNLIGDARAYGAVYTDRDLVEDGDLITARTGGHCHLLARALIDRLGAIA